MIRVAIAGAAGRMGRTLLEAVQTSETMTVTAATVLGDDPALNQDVGTLIGRAECGVVTVEHLATVAGQFDVLVDFTAPAASLLHLAICREQGKAMVIGTTGFSETEKESIRSVARDIPVVFAPNMSAGVNLCMKLLRIAAQVIGSESDIEILEMHHRHKKDAPSGTALKMGEVIAEELGRDLEEVGIFGREGLGPDRNRNTIGFATLRGGDVVGDHTVIFAGAGERVEISHKASSRMTFAAGAVRAAGWVSDKPAGLYTMEDVLSL
ncbi:MAG: 4-hydroxy-tetrahydrodipicolinate reductase [Pseudohongiellaceae bacterium]